MFSHQDHLCCWFVPNSNLKVGNSLTSVCMYPWWSLYEHILTQISLTPSHHNRNLLSSYGSSGYGSCIGITVNVCCVSIQAFYGSIHFWFMFWVIAGMLGADPVHPSSKQARENTASKVLCSFGRVGEDETPAWSSSSCCKPRSQIYKLPRGPCLGVRIQESCNLRMSTRNSRLIFFLVPSERFWPMYANVGLWWDVSVYASIEKIFVSCVWYADRMKLPTAVKTFFRDTPRPHLWNLCMLNSNEYWRD